MSRNGRTNGTTNGHTSRQNDRNANNSPIHHSGTTPNGHLTSSSGSGSTPNRSPYRPPLATTPQRGIQNQPPINPMDIQARFAAQPNALLPRVLQSHAPATPSSLSSSQLSAPHSEYRPQLGGTQTPSIPFSIPRSMTSSSGQRNEPSDPRRNPGSTSEASRRTRVAAPRENGNITRRTRQVSEDDESVEREERTGRNDRRRRG